MTCLYRAVWFPLANVPRVIPKIRVMTTIQMIAVPVVSSRTPTEALPGRRSPAGLQPLGQAVEHGVDAERGQREPEIGPGQRQVRGQQAQIEEGLAGAPETDVTGFPR